MRFVFAVTFVVLLLSASPTAEADTIVYALDGEAKATDEMWTHYGDPMYTDVDTLSVPPIGPALPFTATHSATKNTASCTPSYDFSEASGVTTLSIDVANSATDNGQAMATGDIWFYVDDYTTTYSVGGSGSFSGGGGSVLIRALVWKYDGGQWHLIYDDWRGTADHTDPLNPIYGTSGSVKMGTEGDEGFVGGTVIRPTGHHKGLVDYDKWYVLQWVQTLGALGGSGNPTSTSNITFTLAQVPEPLTIGLLGAGIAGLAAMRRRRRRV